MYLSEASSYFTSVSSNRHLKMDFNNIFMTCFDPGLTSGLYWSPGCKFLVREPCPLRFDFVLDRKQTNNLRQRTFWKEIRKEVTFDNQKNETRSETLTYKPIIFIKNKSLTARVIHNTGLKEYILNIFTKDYV